MRIGIDLGRVADRTVIVVVGEAMDPVADAFTGHFRVLHWESLHGADFATQRAAIEAAMARWLPERVDIDRTGLGWQLAEELAKAHPGVVVPVDGAEQPTGANAGQFLPLLQGLDRAAVSVGIRDEASSARAFLVGFRAHDQNFKTCGVLSDVLAADRNQFRSAHGGAPANQQQSLVACCFNWFLLPEHQQHFQ